MVTRCPQAKEGGRYLKDLMYFDMLILHWVLSGGVESGVALKYEIFELGALKYFSQEMLAELTLQFV